MQRRRHATPQPRPEMAEDTPELTLEEALRDHVRHEEAAADQRGRTADSLWDHLLRAARIAEQLGRAEGLDPATCRLAALFHDAG